MCDGCDAFFRSKKGVIRAAASTNVNRFTDVSELISDINFRVLRWKQRTEDFMEVKNSFFYTVAQNIAIDCKRKRSRQDQFDEGQHEVLLTEQVSLETYQATTARELLTELMDELEDGNDRDALFSFLVGEPIASIAERQGITKNAASVRRRRAIERVAAKHQKRRS